jgi:hypothetical protein
MELLRESQTPEATMRQVLKFYFELPQAVQYNRDFIWVLSKHTMELLAGRELKDAEMDDSLPNPVGVVGAGGPWLMGKKVKRDDSVEGLSYEAPPSKYTATNPVRVVRVTSQEG